MPDQSWLPGSVNRARGLLGLLGVAAVLATGLAASGSAAAQLAEEAGAVSVATQQHPPLGAEIRPATANNAAKNHGPYFRIDHSRHDMIWRQATAFSSGGTHGLACREIERAWPRCEAAIQSSRATSDSAGAGARRNTATTSVTGTTNNWLSCSKSTGTAFLGWKIILS
jgi:hypothetical protein